MYSVGDYMLLTTIKIYNLQNKSFTPVTLVFSGSRFKQYLTLIRVMWTIVRTYGSRTSATTDSASYDVVIKSTQTGEELLGILLDEQDVPDSLNFTTA